SSAVCAGRRALRLPPGPRYMPQSVSLVGLAQRGVIPRKQFYIKLFFFNTVILGLCRLERFAIMTKLLARSLAVKFPSDLDAIPVHAAIPSSGLSLQDLQAGESAFSQTLPGKQPNLYLGLIQPTAMGRRVVDRE